MKRVIVLLMVSLLLCLVACEEKTTGKRVSIPEKIESNVITGGAVVENTVEPVVETVAPSKTAAEALKELQAMETVTADAGPKSGTFYPPVTTTATGKDALAVKTDALFNQTLNIPKVDADTSSGSKYHSADGDPKNLPENYDVKQGYD